MRAESSKQRCPALCILFLLHFTPTVVASLKIRKRLILKKLLPLPAPFQHFRFRFRPLSSNRFCFHKINRFQLPHPWFIHILENYCANKSNCFTVIDKIISAVANQLSVQIVTLDLKIASPCRPILLKGMKHPARIMCKK